MNFVVISLVLIVSVSVWIINRLTEVEEEKYIQNVVITAILVWTIVLIIDGSMRVSASKKELSYYYECIIENLTDYNMTLDTAKDDCKYIN